MYRFTGSARTGYFTGIPARDLSAGDVESLTPAQRATVAASPLYEWQESPDASESGPSETIQPEASSVPEDPTS